MNKKIIASIVSVVVFLLILSGIYFLFFSFKTSDNVTIECEILNIASKVEGKIIELNANLNDSIKKGEIVAKIDSTKYQKEFDKVILELSKAQTDLKISSEDIEEINSNIKKAQEEMDEANLNLENANEDYARYKISYKDGTVTKKDLNNAIKNLEVAREQYKEAQEELKEISEEYNESTKKKTIQTEKIEKILTQIEQAKVNLSNTALIAPFDGVVEEIKVKINDEVKIDTPILKINPKNCKVVAKFENIKGIKQGKKAFIYTSSGKFKGKVINIEENYVEIITSGEVLKVDEITKAKVRI